MIEAEGAGLAGAVYNAREQRDMTTLTGVVKGSTIALDKNVPELDGKRVRLVVEPADGTDAVVENAALWRDWIERGPHGPIENETEADFP